MMSQLRDNVSKYFSNQFKETSLNRDTNMLALTLFNKENLTKALGTFVNAEDVENVASIGNSLKNIYPHVLKWDRMQEKPYLQRNRCWSSLKASW